MDTLPMHTCETSSTIKMRNPSTDTMYICLVYCISVIFNTAVKRASGWNEAGQDATWIKTQDCMFVHGQPNMLEADRSCHML